VIIAIAAVGLVLWAINAWLPMDPGVKRFLSSAVICLLVLWLLRLLGVWDALLSVRV
jgi:hypothetical protein